MVVFKQACYVLVASLCILPRHLKIFVPCPLHSKPNQLAAIRITFKTLHPTPTHPSAGRGKTPESVSCYSASVLVLGPFVCCLVKLKGGKAHQNGRMLTKVLQDPGK